MSSDSETSDSEISMFSETATSDESTHEQLEKALALQFPKCPFHIACVDDLDELEYTFCDELVILIFDDRLNERYKHQFNEMSTSLKNRLRNYTVVKSMNNKPITVRQVLNAMIRDKHYHSRIVEKHVRNYYLEKFIRHPNNMVETCWGN